MKREAGLLTGNRRPRSKTPLGNLLLALSLCAGIAVSLLVGAAGAQTQAPAPKVDATLLQLMRGILYPSSNVVFAAQEDLGKYTRPADPSMSPNPITSTYGGWQAVENASLALAEATHLVLLPGRMCSNGKPVPVERADWKEFTEELRQAALKSYQAAQTKSTDAMLDAASELSDACYLCHKMYREKAGGSQDRCLP